MIVAQCAPWLRCLLRDPIGKSKLESDDDCLISNYGRRYGMIHGAYDLRPLTSCAGTLGRAWARGQDAYERWSVQSGPSMARDHIREALDISDVYNAIPIVGRVLDVGGGDGRLRRFLCFEQEYVSLDPFPGVLRQPQSPGFIAAYPFINEPLNFVAGMAEHLPFASNSFDVIHMRSCVDHFLNPELAFREAYRVLRMGGYLVVGLTVRGGRSGAVSLADKIKEPVRTLLVALGFDRYADHHIWHPSFLEISSLIEATGFVVTTTYWQRSEGDRVCYIRADRSP